MSKFGLPLLLIFILIGMFTGAEGPGGVVFNDAHLTQILGTMALLFILFSGGLSTRIELILPIWHAGMLLASLGVVFSTVIMASFIHVFWGWDFFQAALLGATISSTDAAAVFGILKNRRLGLKPRLQSLLELESGSNDPMAVFLTFSLIHVLTTKSFNATELLLSFLIQMSLGAVLGWLLGLLLVRTINWLDLEFEGLYPVLTIAAVICIYALTEMLGGNGFLSVYLAGLAMGSRKYISKKTLGVFHDGLAWLMQVGMFLALGLLVNPSEMRPLVKEGVLLSVVLMLLARPLSVMLCLLPFRFNLREMWFLSWAGLRGAVPIILATYFLIAAVPQSRMMFNLIFFIVVITMLIQGWSLGPMARLLGLQEPLSNERKLPFKSRHRHSEFIEFFIGSQSSVIGKTIFQLKLPKDVLVVLIQRHGKEFIPRGNTAIEKFDRLVVLAAKSSIQAVEVVMGSEHFLERKIGS
jgi:cell volume regulation protein A